MKKICKYMTIEYYPQSFNNESINVAFVLHNITDGEIYVKRISNKSRIAKFADDVNPNLLIMMLNDYIEFIEEPFKIDLFNKENKQIYNINYLESLTNAFLNEFRLSPILAVETSNPKKMFEELQSLKLYYDLEKSQRPKDADIKRIIKNELESQIKHLNLDYKTNYKLSITENEPSISLDFKLDNLYFKIINFESEKIINKANSAKIWVYNYLSYFKESREKLVFIMDNHVESNKSELLYNIIKRFTDDIYTSEDINKVLVKYSNYYKSDTAQSVARN